MQDHVASSTSDQDQSSQKPLPLLRAARVAFRLGGLIAPKMMGALAYKMVFRPNRAKLRKADAQILADAARGTIAWNGKTAVTYSWGDRGPNVVLVHGWDSCTGHLAHFVRPLRQAGYRVVALDAPAHGASRGTETDVIEYAEFLLQFQKQAGPFAGAVAHSFGGLCLAYVLNHGLTAERVVLISVPRRFDDLQYKIRALLQISDAVFDDIIRRVEARFAPHRDIWMKFSADTNARNLDVPALIIHDVDDKEVPIGESRQLADAWRGASFMTTEGLGHRRILRDDGVIGTTVNFIGKREGTEHASTSTPTA